MGNEPLPKQWSYLRQVALRFIIVLALLQISLGSYMIWFDLTLMPSVATVGGILALSVVPLQYRMPLVARISTVTGGLMGLALGHPAFLLAPVLLAALGLLTYSRPRVERAAVADS